MGAQRLYAQSGPTFLQCCLQANDSIELVGLKNFTDKPSLANYKIMIGYKNILSNVDCHFQYFDTVTIDSKGCFKLALPKDYQNCLFYLKLEPQQFYNCIFLKFYDCMFLIKQTDVQENNFVLNLKLRGLDFVNIDYSTNTILDFRKVGAKVWYGDIEIEQRGGIDQILKDVH